MNKVIVQVPMTKDLRDSAERAAKKQGFSSLQETIRVFLSRLSTGEIGFQVVEEKEERLSKKAERRYAKIVEEIRSGKHVTRTSSPDELFQLLNS